MQIAVVAAKFTPGEADELRRLMSNAWRKKGTMDGVRAKLMRGLNENGIESHYAEQIYRTIEGFANYGFPESHAASFALLTYASCYLKCHHLDVFTCALLNSQPMGFYPPRVLVAEAQRQGVTVRPVDIQNSDYDYTLEATTGDLHAIRVGLRSIAGIPQSLTQNIERERKQNGPFHNLQDFIRRTELPKSMLLKLAASGAFHSFALSARDLIWKIEGITLDRQSFLWGLPKESFADADTEESEIPFESNWERMQREYQSSGFSIDLHPMSVLRPGIGQFSNSKDIKNARGNTKMKVAGLISITQRPPTAKGFCFITLEDEFGSMNIVIPPDVYQKDRMTIYSSSLLEIDGQLEVTGAIRNLRAKNIRPLKINLKS